MKKIVTTSGYSLVEVMVAVSILMLSIVGPITIAAKSLQSAQYARQQNTAFFLAQEGISAVHMLRNDAALSFATGVTTDPWVWKNNAALTPCFAASGCNIDFRDTTLFDNIQNCGTAATPPSCTMRFDEAAGRAVYRGTGSAAFSPYRRVITMQNSGADEVIITSRVEWTSRLLGGTQTITLSSSLFNTYK